VSSILLDYLHHAGRMASLLDGECKRDGPVAPEAFTAPGSQPWTLGRWNQ
jgi:hypothetical protein